MTSATLALQRALLAHLRADATLATSALAGHIHDAAPRDASFPHLVVEEATTRDRSGLAAALTEHRLALRVLSRKGGRHEALSLAGLVEAALDDAPLALDGHRERHSVLG